MVIAGAGASFDSISFDNPYSGSQGYRLPLANNLFGESLPFLQIQSKYPLVSQVWSQLRHLRGIETIEDVLQRFDADSKSNPNRKEQLVAVRYYVQELISTCESRWYLSHTNVPTNMRALLDQIDTVRVNRRSETQPAFVTFNYDRLIEDAINNRGNAFSDINSYVKGGRPPLFKLHGSVNWVHSITSACLPAFPDSGRSALSAVIAKHFGSIQDDDIGEIELMTHTDEFIVNGKPAIPALAIPIKSKNKFECPDSHIAQLKSIIPQVQCVVTIGWRGAEEHFLKLLRENARHQLQGICVAKDVGEAKAVATHLNRDLPHSKFVPFKGNGFSEFVKAGAIERLLNLVY